MVARAFCTLVFLSLLCLVTANNVVDLGYAKYRGNLTFPDTVAYLGLPYAEPPLGNRRWRATVPLNTTRITLQAKGEVLDATSYPDFCVQGTTGQGEAGGAGSEDCLNINVYAPANAKAGAKLPVLVYIHGGGYTFGNPRNWPFDHWVHQSPNVVIASVYYRLDALGFLSHSAFSSDSSLADLNVGFLDQIEALRWVQRHISTFGGDPSQVTINGQSAGASSVELHLVAPSSQGLFSGAIAQSVYRTPLPTAAQQEPLFNFFASAAGCGGGSIATQIACLRQAPLSAIAPAQDAFSFNGSFKNFHPVVDAKTIPTRPTQSILSGSHSRVPLIVGATSNETNSFGFSDLSAALEAFFPALTSQDLAQFKTEYPLSDFDNLSQQIRVGTGESEFRCAVEVMGGAFSKASPTYAYRYNTPTDPSSGATIVEHASENWMMFLGTSTGFNGTTTFQPMTATDKTFAEELIAYWLSFVRTGNPNTHKLAQSPTWPQYNTNTQIRIVLQEGTAARSSSFVEKVFPQEAKRCAFVAGKDVNQQA